MSNKVVATTYRSIIDDVISKIRPEFDEMGIEEEVLVRLQMLWESRVITSGVTGFISPNGDAAEEEIKPIIPQLEAHHSSLELSAPKPEEIVYPAADEPREDNENGSDEPPTKKQRTDAIKSQPDIDPLSDSSAALTAPSAKVEPPGSNTEEVKAEEPVKKDDDDVIGSDLDDSDAGSDGEAAVDGEDIVLCLYDKVHRVKNKWRANLKDGVMSIGGKDYLFSKSSGEFEW